MKKLLIASLFSLSLFGNSIDKPFMSKEMLNNDLETHEYQMFFTKTNDIPLDNLSPKVIFTGKLTDILQSERAQRIKNGFEQHKAIEPYCQSCGFRAE